MTGYIINSVLVLLLILASTSDLKNRTIPNKITFPSMLLGFALRTLGGGISGTADSLLGFTLGFLLFLAPVVLGMTGAGDLKLLAAIGALKGWHFVLTVFVAASVLGGILALGTALWRKRFTTTLLNLTGILLKPLSRMIWISTSSEPARKVYDFYSVRGDEQDPTYLPYALPIALGTLTVLALQLDIMSLIQ